MPYFIYLAFFLAFKFGWVENNTFFCGVTNSEHTFNIDFTRTLRLHAAVPVKDLFQIMLFFWTFYSSKNPEK